MGGQRCARAGEPNILRVQSWIQATEVRVERQQESGALPVFQLPTYNLTGPCTCEGTCCAPVVRRHLSLPHHAPAYHLPCGS